MLSLLTTHIVCFQQCVYNVNFQAVARTERCFIVVALYTDVLIIIGTSVVLRDIHCDSVQTADFTI